MKKMLELLQKKGFRQVSLSVQKENACAVRLYRKSGFEVVRDTPDEYLMICSLSE